MQLYDFATHNKSEYSAGLDALLRAAWIALDIGDRPLSGEETDDKRQGPPSSDPEKAETWLRRLKERKIEFPYLVQLRHWQTLDVEPHKSLGDRFYEQALDVFRDEKSKDGFAGHTEVNVAIFGAAGCGVYISPDGKFRYTVIERAIGFDWSAAHMLLLKVDGLARHSRELWRTDESLRETTKAPEEGQAKPEGTPGWWTSRRNARTRARLRRAIAERGPHCERAYELCTSVFSAINLEKLDREKRDTSQQPRSQQPSEEFGKRVDVIRPEVADAASTFKQAAQRYARGRYGRGMLAGVGVIGVVCVALAVAFSAYDVPAWYGIALLGGGIGATVSVLQRMASNQLRLDYDAGSGMLMALGAVRPLIGAVFGMVLFCAIDGGWLPSVDVSSAEALPFYAVLGFLAGFNERFAQDMLVASTAQLNTRAGASSNEPEAPAGDGREDIPRDTPPQ
jgi:hypothetical protein